MTTEDIAADCNLEFQNWVFYQLASATLCCRVMA